MRSFLYFSCRFVFFDTPRNDNKNVVSVPAPVLSRSPMLVELRFLHQVHGSDVFCSIRHAIVSVRFSSACLFRHVTKNNNSVASVLAPAPSCFQMLVKRRFLHRVHGSDFCSTRHALFIVRFSSARSFLHVTKNMSNDVLSIEHAAPTFFCARLRSFVFGFLHLVICYR